MENDLINEMENLNIAREKTILAEEIFARMEDIPLIDEYRAYQILDDKWLKIGQDLEIIKTEGRSVITQVSPNMITRKKAGKDVEVQDGWIGRIIPFDLVQTTILQKESKNLKEKEERLNQIINEQEEIFDSFSEEDKEELSEALNNDNTAFLAGGLNKLSRDYLNEGDLDSYDEESIEYKVIMTKELSDEEKAIKRDIKDDEDKLHMLTKETIENLSDEKAEKLLKDKWVKPLTDGISNLPLSVLDSLSNKIQAIADKYDTTFADVEEEIEKTEKELMGFIDQLTGTETDIKGLEELKSLLGGV